MAFLAIAGAAAAVGEESLRAADGFERAQAQLQTSIKNSGNSFSAFKAPVDAAIAKFAEFGFNSTQVEEALSHLTTATNSPKKALDELGLAANIAKARNIDLTSASDLLGKVMAGNLRPLKQFGIDLPIAAGGALKVQKAQEAVTKAIQAQSDAFHKYGPESAQYAKATANVHDKQIALASASHASADILAVLNQRFGGAAAAQADTFAGKMEALHTKLHNIETKIGLALIPILEKLADKISTIIGWFEKHKTAAHVLEIALGTLVTAFSLLWLVNTGRKVADAISSLTNFFTKTTTGMGEVGASATTAGEEVGAATVGMSAAFGVLAAAIAGYQIGTIIEKSIVAPAIAHFEHLHDQHRAILSNMITNMDGAFHHMGLQGAQFAPLEVALQRLGDKGVITGKNFGNVSSHIDLLALAIKNHIAITDQMLADLAAGGGRARDVVKQIQDAIDNLHGKTVDIAFNESIQRHVVDYVTPGAQGDVVGVHHKGYIPSFHTGLMPGEYFAKLRTGEAVINERSTAAYAPLLAAINSGGSLRLPAVRPSGEGRTINNYFTVNVPPSANKAEIGREVVEAVRAYEQGNGKSWRS